MTPVGRITKRTPARAGKVQSVSVQCLTVSMVCGLTWLMVGLLGVKGPDEYD